MDLSHVMRTAVDAARRVGPIIRQPPGRASAVQKKRPAEIASQSDPAAERAILQTIHRAFQPTADTIIAANAGIHDERPALPAAEGHL